ncbi:hypothetical protein B0A48_05686 [Cryoendolithus antarcticus]|uniref:Uncharacterized protein n=1 Tax=Cryoendolithus antarcticus TaxID=1507870 RepID=A0A1V8TBN1_9PEZI|nr:hypothetical protein B0A48_05686 [Cryoendolithus antarcticus]
MAPPYTDEGRDLIAMQCRVLEMEMELRAMKDEVAKIQGGGTAILGLLDNHRQKGSTSEQESHRNAFELEQRSYRHDLPQDRTQLHLKTASLETELRLATDQLKMAQAGILYLVGLLGSRAPATLQVQQPQLMLSHELPVTAPASQNPMPWSAAESLLDEDTDLLRFEQMPAGVAWGKGDPKISHGWGKSDKGWGQSDQSVQGHTTADAEGGWVADDPASLYGVCPVYRQTLAKSSSQNSVRKITPPDPFWDGTTELQDCIAINAPQIAYPKPTPEHFNLPTASPGAQMYRQDSPASLLLRSPIISTTGLHGAPALAPRVSQRQAYFTQSEHSRLKGMACFIEDMEENDKKLKWQDFANAHRGHTLDQWVDYYANDVRPNYLEQQLRRVAAVAAPGTLQQTSDVNGSVDTSQGDLSPVFVSSDSHSPKSAGARAESANGASPSVTNMEVHLQVTDTAHVAALPDNNTKDGPASPISANDLNDAGEPAIDVSVATALDVVPQPQHEDVGVEVPIITAREVVLPPLHGNLQQLAECREMHQAFTEPTAERSRPRDTARHSWTKESTDKQSQDTSSNGSRPYCLYYNALRNITPNELAWAKVWDQSFTSSVFFKYEDGDLAKVPELRRSVLVQGIPPATLLGTVLDNVHTGKLVRARFIDTTLMRTTPPSGDTVMLEFQSACGASDLVQSTPQLTLPTAGGHGRETATVSLVPTPTRPTSEFLRTQQDSRISRVIYLADHRKQFTAFEVMNRLWHVDRSLTEPVRPIVRPDGVIVLEFASTSDAGKTLYAMGRLGVFRNMGMGYAADPCASGTTESNRNSENVDGHDVADDLDAPY